MRDWEAVCGYSFAVGSSHGLLAQHGIRLFPEHPPFGLTLRLGGNYVIDGIRQAAAADRPPPLVRRRFSKEFKADAVVLVLDGDRPAAVVSRDLGIGEGTPVNWVRQARVDRGDRPGLTTSERSELVELRRENAKLWMERELLKGATAFAVLELGQ